MELTEHELKQKEAEIERLRTEAHSLRRELSNSRLYRNPQIPDLVNALSETLREGNIPKFKDIAYMLYDSTQAEYTITPQKNPMEKLYSMFKKQNYIQLPKRLGNRKIKLGSTLVIGARPGGGKTKTMVNYMYEFIKKEIPCVFFSFEMDEEDIVLYIAQQWLYEHHQLAISYWEMPKILYTDEFKAIRDEFKKFLDQNKSLFLVVESAGYTATDVVHALESVSEAMGTVPGVVFLDYLQLVQRERGFRGSGKEAMDAISNILTTKCKRMKKTAFVMASQLNRGSEKNSTPSSSDFKESGAIEQDSSTLLILERPKDDYGDFTKEYFVWCVKDRFGGQMGKTEFSLEPKTWYISQKDTGGF